MIINMPQLVTFLVYIFSLIFIGLLAYKNINNFEDYVLGGRRLGSVVTALSAGASDMSGWLLMGLPGAIFLHGIAKIWIVFGLTIGAYLNWKLVAGRLRVHTEANNNALTLPDYFTHRFADNSKLLRVIPAVVILLFCIFYSAAGIVASARLFESSFGVSYASAIWAGAAATVAYTFIGGFLAVSWTDTVQATLMIFALILTPVMVIIAVGGIDASVVIISARNIAYLDLFNKLDAIAIISLLGWGLGYFGQPHILARFMAVDSHHSLAAARRISMIWMILCLLGAVAVGFFGIAYFDLHPELASNVQQNSEMVLIELAKLLFNPWIAGVILSAILAAIMSTLSCQLLVCSSAITEDLYKGFLRKKASEKELVFVGRCMVLLIAFIAIALALNPENRVLGLVAYAWAGFGAAFGPVVLISLTWWRMTRNAALAGMLVGAITVIIWKQFAWFGVYEIIPGFLLASCTIVIVSWMDKVPCNNIIERFHKATLKFKLG